MKPIAFAAAALLLAACSPSGTPSNPRQALIGRWGDDGNCAAPLTFNADGSFRTGAGGGTWTLTGGHLTLTGAGGAFGVDLTWQDHDHMTITHPDGSTGRSSRCP